MWALSQVGFVKSTGSEPGFALLTKSTNAHFVLCLLVLALESLARAVWAWVTYRGGDIEHVRRVLDSAYDDLQFEDERRFWKDVTG